MSIPSPHPLIRFPLCDFRPKNTLGGGVFFSLYIKQNGGRKRNSKEKGPNNNGVTWIMRSAIFFSLLHLGERQQPIAAS